MTKTAQNFTMWSGDDKEITVTVTDADGNSVALAGATVKWTLRKTVTSSEVISKQTGGDGITLSSNTFTVSLNPADTSDLAGTYYHEAEVTDSSGNVSTVMTGTVTIERDAIT